MSMPGPDYVIACPYCRAPARVPTMSSISFSYGSAWSDGTTWWALVPGPMPIARCRACERCYVRDRAETIDEVDFWDEEGSMRIRQEWRNAPYTEEPTEEECFTALARADVADDPDLEFALRFVAWHAYNHPYRREPAPGEELNPPMSAASRANLEAIVARTPLETDADRLQRAELLRQLQQFDAARELLEAVRDPKLRPQAERGIGWCEARVSRVQQVPVEYG